ncbi:hypothetical protein PGT21_032757 [Puccinia graminis f. sp. tritici]|uniref:Uncharacterized protein n=1 Tax=Puccinia graminis f. sp. tritici TaxID=56615 RepID=A0A5B0MMI5_PUCGR|nr:hypothetical protein PGT21_032757 [Puccinia graminis f. sp. tritici]
MAVEVDCLIKQDTGFNLDIANNHIHCFCHKVALILNAGLKALDVSTVGLTKSKKRLLALLLASHASLNRKKKILINRACWTRLLTALLRIATPPELEGGNNVYNNIEISQSDWDLLKQLNNILGEFYFITKKMEGDISSAGMMLA